MHNTPFPITLINSSQIYLIFKYPDSLISKLLKFFKFHELDFQFESFIELVSMTILTKENGIQNILTHKPILPL